MSKFKIYHDTQPDDVVETIGCIISNFGLNIEVSDDTVGGVMEYKVVQDPENAGLPFHDIRNKLGPLVNLVAMVENHLDNPKLKEIIKQEIEQAKISINYLKGIHE